MMTQVLVTGIDGTEIRCSDGVTRNAVGNSRVCVGDILWSNGDYVMSPGEPASRAPLVWADAPMHFADSSTLKMLYVDEKFKKVTKSTAIKLPGQEGSNLPDNTAVLLHCYNARVEYFVWLHNPSELYWKCLIRKNGKVLTDFSTDFAAFSFPSMCDAYIDASGDLIWGASEWVNDYVSIATYKNAEKTKTFILDETATEAAFGERLRQRVLGVEFSVSRDVFEPEITSQSIISTIRRDGLVYQADFAGCAISDSYGSAYLSNPPVQDLFNADALISVASWGSVMLSAQITAMGMSGEDGLTMVDQSYIWQILNASLANTTIFRASNNEVIAELQQPDAEFENTVSGVPSSITVTETYSDTPEAVNCYVTADSPHNATEFTVSISAFMSAAPALDIMRSNSFSVEGHNGGNVGVFKNATMGVVSSNEYKYHLYFAESWPEAPSVGDLFTFQAYPGTQSIARTESAVTVTATLPIIDSPVSNSSIVTDIGNGYSIAKKPKIESVQGWVSASGELRHDGDTIYTDRLPLDGAWKTSAGAAVGLVNNAEGGKVLLVKKQAAETVPTVVEIVPPFNPSLIVTKRFT
ncbi:MAG: hypothetical protein AB9917_13610 [Negativicutes bacterium]